MTKPKPSPLNESGLIVGSIGRGYGYLRRVVAKYQAALVGELEARKMPLDVGTLSILQTAMRWEMAALAATKLCRQPDLAPLDRAALVRQIASASGERDKCLAKLGIDRPESPTAKYKRQMAERQAARGMAQLGPINAKSEPSTPATL